MVTFFVTKIYKICIFGFVIVPLIAELMGARVKALGLLSIYTASTGVVCGIGIFNVRKDFEKMRHDFEVAKEIAAKEGKTVIFDLEIRHFGKSKLTPVYYDCKDGEIVFYELVNNKLYPKKLAIV